MLLCSAFSPSPSVPKTLREAPAVASPIREPRNASVANTTNCDLTRTKALDNLLHYPLFSDTGDEHRLGYDTDLGFEQASGYRRLLP